MQYYSHLLLADTIMPILTYFAVENAIVSNRSRPRSNAEVEATPAFQRVQRTAVVVFRW